MLVSASPTPRDAANWIEEAARRRCSRSPASTLIALDLATPAATVRRRLRDELTRDVASGFAFSGPR